MKKMKPLLAWVALDDEGEMIESPRASRFIARIDLNDCRESCAQVGDYMKGRIARVKITEISAMQSCNYR